MIPRLIEGSIFEDNRGCIKYNNNFNASEIKRIYFIENIDINFNRGWQGHKIEQRWFVAVSGSFKIQLIKIDNWDTPSVDLLPLEFKISSEKLNVLHIPSGYISCIKALDEKANLLVMANYLLKEVEDEYRFPLEYFNFNNFE